VGGTAAGSWARRGPYFGNAPQPAGYYQFNYL